jgi:hypothetical protein
VYQGDWEGVFQKTTSLSARELLQYIMDDVDDHDHDDVPSKPNKKKTSKKKKKSVEGSEEEKATSTKHKSTGAKKKRKSKKKKYPPSLLETNESSESVSVLTDDLGGTYLESEKVGLGAVSEEDSGDSWDHHRDTACLEEERTKKTKAPTPQPEATASDSQEFDNADMVLDHLTLLLDRLLDEEEYDINKWVHGTQWAIKDEEVDDRSKWNRSRAFPPGEERSHSTDEDESAPPRSRECDPTPSEDLTKPSVSKTKATKHKSLAKKEHITSLPSLPNKNNGRDDLPKSVETKPKRRSLPSVPTLSFLRSLPNKNKDHNDLAMIVETKPKRRSSPSVPPLPFLRSVPNKNNDREDLPMIVETKHNKRSMLAKIKEVLQMRET